LLVVQEVSTNREIRPASEKESSSVVSRVLFIGYTWGGLGFGKLVHFDMAGANWGSQVV
jgi:hypothetical protein